MKNYFFILLLASCFMLKAEHNEITLNSYESKVEKYMQGTPQQVTGEMKEWIDGILTYVAKQGLIFEIGGGFGRDAHYIRSCGYSIKTSDATPGFVHYLQNAGFDAQLFNVLKDNFDLRYDMIFANAVFLHFTPQELSVVLSKIHGALNRNGILAFSLKNGIGQDWSEEKLGAPRYFCYWQPESIQKEVVDAGFEIITLKKDVSGKWLHIIAKKGY